MTTYLQILVTILCLNCIFSCTSPSSDNTPVKPAQTSIIKNTKSTETISGIVWDIQYGKDGYTATISTTDASDYYAVISIPNVGGPDNYVELQLGDTATVSGEPIKSADENRLMVREIVSHSPAEFCWLAKGPTNLYSEPNADSKNYGRFFQGETLTVLAKSIKINNKIWTRVYFRGTVKAGYEDKFADGRPMHEGIESMVGWIGGESQNIISCK